MKDKLEKYSNLKKRQHILMQEYVILMENKIFNDRKTQLEVEFKNLERDLSSVANSFIEQFI